MFREMRRKDRELKNDEVIEILKKLITEFYQLYVKMVIHMVYQ